MLPGLPPAFSKKVDLVGYSKKENCSRAEPLIVNKQENNRDGPEYHRYPDQDIQQIHCKNVHLAVIQFNSQAKFAFDSIAACAAIS